MAVKIRRLKPLQPKTAKTTANVKGIRIIRVKNNVALKVDSRYLQEVQNQSRYDKVRRDRDRQASMELAGVKYSQ